jgi:hypothetical protein
MALSGALSTEAKQQAEEAKAQAVAATAKLQVQWDAAKADLQQKDDAVRAAREAAVTTEAARAAAAEAAHQAARELEPVSVLISRKTQRLYVRQAFEPIFESPVTIADPDRPIGTHLFTAVERLTDDASLRWTVVSLGSGLPTGTVGSPRPARGSSSRTSESMPTDPENAKAALDRIAIPQDALDRIPPVSARSSLIVTDEALSAETGKGTDFVVLLSGEPQGGIKSRRRNPETEFYAHRRDRLRFWRSPFAGPFWNW